MAFALPEGVPTPTQNRIVEYSFTNRVGEVVRRPAMVCHVDHNAGLLDLFVFFVPRLDGAKTPEPIARVGYGGDAHCWRWPEIGKPLREVKP